MPPDHAATESPRHAAVAGRPLKPLQTVHLRRQHVPAAHLPLQHRPADAHRPGRVPRPGHERRAIVEGLLAGREVPHGGRRQVEVPGQRADRAGALGARRALGVRVYDNRCRGNGGRRQAADWARLLGPKRLGVVDSRIRHDVADDVYIELVLDHCLVDDVAAANGQ